MVIKEEFIDPSIEVLHRDKARVNRVVTLKATPRVERLRETQMKQRPWISIDKLRLETKVMKETEGEPMEIRRAKFFSAFVREVPISIFTDELIVGCAREKPQCREISPEDLEAMETGWLETASERDFYNPGVDSARLDVNTDEERREVQEEIIPYWKGEGKWERTRHGLNYTKIPPEILNLMVSKPTTPPTLSMVYSPGYGLITGGNIGHNVLGYEKVLKKGFLGVKKDAEERLARIDHSDSDDLKKIPFLEGVIIAMQAAAEIGSRFAAKARELADSEEDADRKEELLKIAEISDWVPANPARTFREALQSLFFARLLVWWETSYTAAHSPGRIERHLDRFYESDMKAENITKEEVQELLDCYLIKLSQVGTGNHISVGGVKPNGQDATSDLSYMLIDGVAHVKLTEPYFSILVHGKTPDSLLIKAAKLCSLGMGHPVFINHDVQIQQMLSRPIPLEHARNVASVGCYEPVIPGYDAGLPPCGILNFGALLEMVMTNGWNRAENRKLGMETGDPRQFKSFEEVREALRKQVAWLCKDIITVHNLVEETLADICPTIYESALIDDCIENGTTRESGGARYNFSPIVSGAGAIDAGDSLAAIKKLVFEEKKITMGELCDALDNNFEGYEEIHQMLLNAPKYGNDDDYADEQSAWASHLFAEEVSRLKNPRGGYATPIGAPLMMYMYCGWYTGALPSGRLAGKPLSDAWSPCAGNDVNGPTSVLKSMGKIDHVELRSGVTLNMRIDPVVFKGEDEIGVKRLADMIRTFVDQKIFHVQINVVSSDTLRAAQKEPDKFRDILVKVAGYSAFFVKLPKGLQDGIIMRTEHKL
ncbi:hypothetical protein LCGC14_0320890 [marine sediment metagenome]|uniref:PFL domain-containing protein n=1 Tax=marine sediment metagenome TaxID=412755 RepID=A0A0F9U227_9ZZZZ